MKASVDCLHDLTLSIKPDLTTLLMIASILAAPSVSADEDWLSASCNLSINGTNSSSASILGFDFSPKDLIIDDSSAMVTLKADIAADGLQIQSIEVVLASPSGSQSRSILLNASNLISPKNASRKNISRDDSSNIQSYAGRISFAPSSEEGDWSLQQLRICSMDSICTRINGSEAERLGLPVTLRIRKAGTEGEKVIDRDIEGPEGPSIALDPEELRGWSNTDVIFYKNRKIIINNVFNRPALCGP